MTAKELLTCPVCGKGEGIGAEERLAALREYVREKVEFTNTPEHEAGGIAQRNFRAGMALAYRDIEKRLGPEPEGKQL